MPKKAGAPTSAARPRETSRKAEEAIGDDAATGGDDPIDDASSDIGLAEPEDEELVGLDEAQEEDNTFTIWYGPPGSTKTTSIARLLLARPVGKLIICNAEAGLKVRALRRHGIPTERIVIWPKPGVRPTFDGLERLVLKIDAELAAARRAGEPKPYCGFAGDSITELVKLMLDNITESGIENQRDLDRRAKIAGVTPPRRDARKRFKTERDDYGLVSNQVRAILRKLRYMPIDVMFTALTRRDEDQDTGATMYGPATPPALQQDLLGMADIVIRTERRKGTNGREEIVGYTLSDENHHGKDRYGLLPAEILPPGADVVLGYITGAVIDSPITSPESDPLDETGGHQPSGPDGGESDDLDIAAEAEVTGESELEIEARRAAEIPARKPATRKKASVSVAARSGHDGRIDARTMKAVGKGDGTNDEPPF